MFYKSFVLIIMCFNVINGYQLSKEYPICKKSDPNFEECVCKAITKVLNMLGQFGDKELGIRKIEPTVVEEVIIPGNGGKVDLEQRFMDMNFNGFGSTEVKKFKLTLNEKECKIEMETLIPKFSLTGRYKIIGKVLVFTLNGFGNNNTTITNLKTLHELECEKSTKNGKEFLNIVKYNVDLQPETLYFDMENVVDGNAELSAQILKVVNENALDVFAGIKADYGNAFGEIFRQLANSLFNKIPINQIFME